MDNNLKVTSQIVINQKELDKYRTEMIKILRGQADSDDALFNEATRKYLDVFTTRDENVEVLVVARKQLGFEKGVDFAEVDKELDKCFIKYAESRTGVAEPLNKYFDKIIWRIERYFKNEKGARKLSKEIMSSNRKSKNYLKSRTIAIIGIISYVLSVLASAENLEGTPTAPTFVILLSAIFALAFYILASVRLWKIAKHLSIMLIVSGALIFLFNSIQAPDGSSLVILFNLAKIFNLVVMVWAIFKLFQPEHPGYKKTKNIKNNNNKVLHFEKDKFLAEIYNKRLSKSGLSVKTISNPTKDSINEVISFKPFLVIMGTFFENIDEFKFTKKIKKGAKTKEVLVVFLSNMSSDKTFVKKALKSGANDFISFSDNTPEENCNKILEMINDNSN